MRSRRGAGLAASIGRGAALSLLLGACGPAPPADPDAVARTGASSHVQPAAFPLDSLEAAIGAIADASGAEVGVAAIHLESGLRVAHNGRRRFPMASVYKLPIALEVLRAVDEGRIALGDSITVHPTEFVGGANPLVRSSGGRAVTASVARLLAYMLGESDNTASDALMRAVGGPAAVRRRLAELGVYEIDVSRYEGEIFAEARRRGGSLDPGPMDLRDTATPAAMADLLGVVHRGAGLSPASRALLVAHLAATEVGTERIKGFLPAGTPVAHKTGTFDRVTNDAGLVVLPDGSHLALAVFARGGPGGHAARERAIATIARAAYDAFAPALGGPIAPADPAVAAIDSSAGTP